MAKKLQSAHSEEEMRDIAAKICKNYLHGLWKVVDPSEMQFRKVCGGLSNYIYVMSLPEDVSHLYPKLDQQPDMDESTSMSHPEADETGPRKVLLRIYGQIHGERAMDAIVTESVIFTLLSERRLGPKLYGVFSGGRIEEYIPGRSLLTKELSEPALSMKIAEKIATIHSLDIPLSKEPTFIWKTMLKWLKTAKEECFKGELVGKNEEEQKSMNTLREVNFDLEIEWLSKYLSTVESPVVFCHNDLQEGNIMLLQEPTPAQTDDFDDTFDNKSLSDDEHQEPLATDGTESSTRKVVPTPYLPPPYLPPGPPPPYEDAETTDTIISHMSDSGEPKIFFIDFEYCAYNYRGFDLANHFQEWVYDYTNPEYPWFHVYPEQAATLEQKEIFIKEYLKHYNSNQSDDKEQQVTIDDINKLLGEIEAYALASHLFWTLWSIVNGGRSKIAFGYWEYGVKRLETYLQLKQEVIKKEKFGLPQKRKIEEVDI